MAYDDNPTNLFTFKEGATKYAFDCNNLDIIEVNPVTDAILDCIRTKGDINEVCGRFQGHEVRRALDYVNTLSMSASDKGDKSHFKPTTTSRKAWISLAPTELRCNLRCSYCYNSEAHDSSKSHKEFDKGLIRRTLEYIYFDLFSDRSRYRIDFVDGGEPLLRLDLIKAVKEIGDSLYKETGKPLEMWLTTNGTLLNEEILDYLDNSGIGLGISLDGDRETHDSLRKSRNGEGTYDAVTLRISNMNNSNRYGKLLDNMWAFYVVTGKTKSLVNALATFRDLGFKIARGKLVRSTKGKYYSINSANIHHIKQLYSELIESFKNEFLNNRYVYLAMILNNFDLIGKMIRRLILKERPSLECSAATNVVTITSDGDIFPCPMFTPYKEFRIGTLTDGIDTKKRGCFYDSIGEALKRRKCAECWLRFLCGGSCIAYSYEVNGDIARPDDIVCELLDHLARLSLGLVCFLRAANPTLYESLLNSLNVAETKSS